MDSSYKNQQLKILADTIKELNETVTTLNNNIQLMVDAMNDVGIRVDLFGLVGKQACFGNLAGNPDVHVFGTFETDVS